LAETAFAVLRKKLLFEQLARSGSGPKERKLAILGFFGPRDFLASALNDTEKQWLATCDAIPADALMAPHRHNLPEWMAQALQAQLGDDFWALAEHLQQPGTLDLRVNMLNAKRSDIQKELAQAGIAVGLFNMAHLNPVGHLGAMAALALLVAFSSATQDVAIDAWRIEAVPQSMQGVMAAAYQLGYRVAIMVASAGALWIAADFGWTAAYTAMAVMVGVGIATTLVISEPQPRVAQQTLDQEQRVVEWLEHKAHWPESLRQAGSWFVGAVVCPFVDFFTRYGTKLAVLMLAFIASYRLTDFTMGVMANPFYLDVGYTLKEIAAVAKLFGLVSSIVGVVLGGLAVARLGTVKSLAFGSLAVIASNLMFVTLAVQDHPSLTGLAIVVSADNLAMGVAGTALIAYLSENGLPWVAQQAEEDVGVTQESSVASVSRTDGTAKSATGGTAGGRHLPAYCTAQRRRWVCH
jgi:hypothetical protein